MNFFYSLGLSVLFMVGCGKKSDKSPSEPPIVAETAPLQETTVETRCSTDGVDDFDCQRRCDSQLSNQNDSSQNDSSQNDGSQNDGDDCVIED